MGAASCTCSDKCCGDEIRGQVPNEMPGLPMASEAPGFPDLDSLPRQALALDPRKAAEFGSAGLRTPTAAAAIAAAAVDRHQANDHLAEDFVSRRSAADDVDEKRGGGGSFQEEAAAAAEAALAAAAALSATYPASPRPVVTGAAQAEVVERRWGKPATIGGLEIGFLLPDGSERHVAFGNVGPPLGIEFGPNKPCTLKKVAPGSPGEKLGIQPGWIVEYVNGDSVAGRDVDYVFELMRRALLGQKGPGGGECCGPSV
mmetsp:Transcript_363/g.755  ORF Transcript_363/g.755 Transcript_363/m.755 type:complete len:258 (-) Transcript_363:31-804(-)